MFDATIDKKNNALTIVATKSKIAEKIIEQGGHCFLSVKGNQQGLSDDMKHAFKLNKGTVFTDETESNHGRIETRQCSILPVKGYLLEEYFQAWKQVAT
ncbi:hypothetical protein EZS27_018217 [termite gut metagenome]|uniref:Uncharacterized protein n=1 Tax=termite gut metagenome TaxID=433724 RepID=A0A5J4RIJ6_9ZZZZ